LILAHAAIVFAAELANAAAGLAAASRSASRSWPRALVSELLA
jgi:hypothetical protein